MFPNNALSIPVNAHVGIFNYPVKSPLPEDKLQDWEVGGIALGDNSAGLEYQVWHAFAEVDEETDLVSIYVEAPNTPPTLVFADYSITDIALAFDQNMRASIAYVRLGISYIYWYNPLVPGMVHTELPVGARIPQWSLDDKRRFNVAASDICLVYNRNNKLYLCYQRERYAAEYYLMDTQYEAIHIGMNNVGAVQIGLGAFI